MGITTIDGIIIVLYLLAVALIGSLSGGKQRSTKDYFMGGANVPWWAVAFAIVAAETSSLTFISIPGLAYISNLNFLQLTIGYLVARTIIAFLFLPAYKKGELATAYSFLETRFGFRTRRFASTVFLFTRIAADGVRLFATAIPLALIFKSTEMFRAWPNFNIYLLSIVIIALVSLIYTYTGGVKGVIWADVLQMTLYIGGAILALFVLIGELPPHFRMADLGDKLEIFNFSVGGSIGAFFREPYTIFSALIGGAFLSMASHGTDQLIVQRLFTTRTLKDSQKAIITSGLLVMFQFALFLVVGLLLFVFYKGVALGSAQAPFIKADEIFPYFIIHNLPVGVTGIIVAGLFAAAMSTLAGSISSLSSSAMLDLIKPLFGSRTTEKNELFISRLITVVATLILVLVAFIFIRLSQSVVEIALGIASITYGGLLGTFLMGLLSKRVNETGALVGFSAGIITMLLVSIVPFVLGTPPLVHWTWYVALGTGVTMLSGGFFRDKKEV